MSRRLVIIIVIVLAGVLVGLSTYFALQQKQINNEQELALSFVRAHGNEAVLISVDKVEKIYVVRWKKGETVFLSINIDGAWIDIQSGRKESE